MRRGGSLKRWAAALLLGLGLTLLLAAVPFTDGAAQDDSAADTAAPGETATDDVTPNDAAPETVDTAAPIYRYTHDTCRSIFAAAAPDPQGACDCMTPILMQRLTPEARERIAADPDQLPFGVTLFRDATPEEEAAQRACMN